MAIKNNIYVRCLVKDVRFAFVRLFELDTYGGKEKYSVTLLIPKNSPSLTSVKESIKLAAVQGSEILNGAKVDLSAILRDGDTKAEVDGYNGFEGCYYIKASTDAKYKPEVFKSNPSGIGGKTVQVTDPNEVYPGCFGMALVEFHPYNNMQSGVSCILRAVCKTAEGDRLSNGGGSDAEDVFGSELEDLPADDVF